MFWLATSTLMNSNRNQPCCFKALKRSLSAFLFRALLSLIAVFLFSPSNYRTDTANNSRIVVDMEQIRGNQKHCFFSLTYFAQLQVLNMTILEYKHFTSYLCPTVTFSPPFYIVSNIATHSLPYPFQKLSRFKIFMDGHNSP